MEYRFDVPPPRPATRDGSFRAKIAGMTEGASFFAKYKTTRDAHATARELRRRGIISFYLQTQTQRVDGVDGLMIWRVEKRVRG